MNLRIVATRAFVAGKEAMVPANVMSAGPPFDDGYRNRRSIPTVSEVVVMSTYKAVLPP
jgi:hypothetical protein